MASNYTELLAEVEDWAKRPDLTAKIPDFVLYAEKRMNRDLTDDAKNTPRQMESSADVTISSQTAALPSDFLKVRRLYITTDPITVLQYLTPDVFWSTNAASVSGTPTAYTIEGSNLVFAKSPDGTYTGKLTYQAAIPALVSNTTNWLLTAAPDMYIYASLISLAQYTRDTEYLNSVSTLYEEAKEALMNGGKYGGALRYVPKVSP